MWSLHQKIAHQHFPLFPLPRYKSLSSNFPATTKRKILALRADLKFIYYLLIFAGAYIKEEAESKRISLAHSRFQLREPEDGACCT
jgi:hypothetical protein